MQKVSRAYIVRCPRTQGFIGACDSWSHVAYTIKFPRVREALRAYIVKCLEA
jgi:hypothetical protein